MGKHMEMEDGKGEEAGRERGGGVISVFHEEQ